MCQQAVMASYDQFADSLDLLALRVQPAMIGAGRPLDHSLALGAESRFRALHGCGKSC